MTARKIYTYRLTDSTPNDHIGHRGEITYRDGYLYYHDGATAGGELINGGGSGGGGPTSWSSVTGKPSFATVATSGSYADLTGKPSIPSVGDFIFSSGDASLPAGNHLTLSTFRSGANEESKLTLNPTGESSLYASGVLKLGTGYGSGSEQYWQFGANGNLTIPGDIVDSTGTSVLGGGTTLPTDASGYLVNDGSGNLSWAAGDGTFSGDYNDLTNKPSIPDLTGYATEAWVNSQDFGSGGGGGATALSGLSDVSLEGPIEGSVLTWNNSQNHWENRDIPVATQIANTDGISTYSVSVGTDGVVTMNTVRGGIEFGAMPEVGGPNHLHIMRPAGAEGATDLYFGDDYNYVKMPALYGAGTQGVEIGSSYNSGAVSVWKFGTDGDLVLPAGKTIRDTSGVDLFADPSTGDPAYKGFKAHYGRMWGNDSGPINKIVIYKDTATPSSTIDASTNNDDFAVTGLTGSDVVVMLVAIGEDSNQTTTAELKTFAEYIIDNVILDGGVEGDINTAAAMKTAFYDNFAIFSATLTDLKTGFEFFTFNNQFNISPAFATGKGATFSSLQYNMADDTVGSGSWGQDVGTHQVGDVFVIPGDTIQDANSNFLATPANDVTITITTATDGYIGSFTVTGTLPRPAETWPSNSIGDGGDDEYDTGNYITTNLESNISYNGGDVVSGSSAFGGGDYVVTYQNSIFGVFAVNSAIDSIATDGSSGFDGNGQADTGSLYGAASGVSIGDFVFNGSTMTSPDDDLYIKAVDDLWLDALDDDVHIRANDDVRIKAGYNFADDDAQAEWRFGNEGIIYFPNGSEQSTAWMGNVDWDDVNNRPSIPADVSDLTDTTNLLSASVSSLVNGSKTVSLGTNGVLTLPEGSAINDAIEVVAVTLDQFNDGGFSGTQVFTKVSDTLYQVLPSGPTMELITGTWYLKIGVATYYNSVDRITWEVSAGALPAPVGTLTTLVGMKLTVDGYDWMFDDDGGLTLPAGGTITEGGGFTGAIKLTPAGGANEYQALVIYPTAAGDGDHIHLTAGGGTTELYLGNDVHYVKIENGGNVVIQAFDSTGPGAKQWLFDKNGDLTLPVGGDILDSTGASVLGGGTTLPANASGYLVNDGTGALSWAAGDGTFSGDYDDLTNKPTLFSGDYDDLTNKPTIRIAVATGAGPGGNLQADSLALAGLNPVTDIPSTWGGDLILQGGVGGANGDLYGEVRIKSGQIGANYEWHFTTDKKIKLPAGGDIVNSTGTSVMGGSGSYTPANAGNWAGTAPTTIAEALDRVAAKLAYLSDQGYGTRP